MFSRIFELKIKRCHREIGLNEVNIENKCSLNILIKSNIYMNIHWNQLDSNLHIQTTCIRLNFSHSFSNEYEILCENYNSILTNRLTLSVDKKSNYILLSDRYNIEILDSTKEIIKCINIMAENTKYWRNHFEKYERIKNSSKRVNVDRKKGRSHLNNRNFPHLYTTQVIL